MPETASKMFFDDVHHAGFSNETSFRAVRPSIAGEDAIRSIPRSSVPGLSLDPLLLGMGQEFADNKETTRTSLKKNAIMEEDDDVAGTSSEDDDDDDADDDADEDGAEDGEASVRKSAAEAQLWEKKARRADLATKKIIRQRQRQQGAGAVDDLAKEALGFGLHLGAAAAFSAAQRKTSTKEEKKAKKLIKEEKDKSSNLPDISTADVEEGGSRPGSDAGGDDRASQPSSPRSKVEEPDEDIFSPQMIEETLNKMKIVREQCLACTVPYTNSSQQRAETTMRGMLAPAQEKKLQEDEVRVRRFLRWEEDKRQDAEHAQSGLRKTRAAVSKLGMLGRLAQGGRRNRDFEDHTTFTAELRVRQAPQQAVDNSAGSPAAEDSMSSQPPQSARNSSSFRTAGQVVHATTKRGVSFSAQKDSGTSLPPLVTQ